MLQWRGENIAVYLLGITEKLVAKLQAFWSAREILFAIEKQENGEYCIKIADGKLANAGEEFHRYAMECTRQLHRENLFVLMEESPKGRMFDISRLMKEGEVCVLYFFYRLALKILKEGIAGDFDKSDIKLLSLNASGHRIALELGKMLGLEVISGEESGFECRPGEKYLLIRDVIHVFYELEKHRNFILENGGEVLRAVGLLDINTGVGNKVKRISLYTIDLEKGISYRLKQKMVTFSE